MTVATTSPAPISSGFPAKIEYARLLAESGLLPASYRKQPANLLYALEYAESLGLHPMVAITGIHVIDGKPAASAGLISSLVRRAGHRLRVTGDDTHAIAEIVRADDPSFTFRSEWTLDRARTAGLAGKGTWAKYPAAMLKARAITEVARDACEDALTGIRYTPEELGAEVDAEGDVIAPAMTVDTVNGPITSPKSPAIEAAPVTDRGLADVVPMQHAENLLAAADAATDVDTLRDLYRQAAALPEPPRETVRAAIMARRDALLAGTVNPEPEPEPVVEEAVEALEAGEEVTVAPGADPVVEEWPPPPADPVTGELIAPGDLELPKPDVDPTDRGVAPTGRGKGSGKAAFEKAKQDLAAKQAAKRETEAQG